MRSGRLEQFPHQSTGKPFFFDRTLKSLFAERDVVRELLYFHAADLFPDLQGFEPLELVSASTVTADLMRNQAEKLPCLR